jgi:hypothetical protein
VKESQRNKLWRQIGKFYVHISLVICRAQRPGQPIGEITWNDFYYNLLLKVRKQNLTLSWLGPRKQFQISYINWKYQDNQKHFCILFCIRSSSWFLLFNLFIGIELEFSVCFLIKLFHTGRSPGDCHPFWSEQSHSHPTPRGCIQGAGSSHTGRNGATAILHPGAVYKGQTLPTQVGIEQQPSYTQGLCTRARLYPHR